MVFEFIAIGTQVEKMANLDIIPFNHQHWFPCAELREKTKKMLEIALHDNPFDEVFMTIDAMEESFVNDLVSSPCFMWTLGYEPTYCVQIVEFMDKDTMQIRIPLIRFEGSIPGIEKKQNGVDLGTLVIE